jgi:hypothetical protein
MINYFIIKFIPITFSFSILIYILKLMIVPNIILKFYLIYDNLKIIKKLKKRNKIKMNKI